MTAKSWKLAKTEHEHKLVCMPHKPLLIAGVNAFDGWYELVCAVCHKQVDYYWPRPNDPEPPPPWVQVPPSSDR